jgi:hypothetical protein
MSAKNWFSCFWVERNERHAGPRFAHVELGTGYPGGRMNGNPGWMLLAIFVVWLP